MIPVDTEGPQQGALGPGPSKALEDCRVLDLTDAKGAYCAKLLADLGADVIKIEPPVGDPTRRVGPFKDDSAHPERSLPFLYLNSNKRGITLNLRSAHGQKLFKGLVEKADVVIESFPSGFLAGLRLDYPVLREINPAVVMTSISGFGRSGPYKDYQDPDIVVFAMGGLMHVSGAPDGPPCVAPETQAYYQAATYAAAGTLLAFLHARATGQGQYVEISGQEVLLCEEHMVGRYSYDGHIVGREGSQHGTAAPGSIFPCKDGHVYLFVTTAEQWRRLLDWIGNPEALSGSVWDDPSFRRANVDVLNAFVCEFTLKHTKEELYREGQDRHIAVAPVRSPAEATQDLQTQARGYFVEADHPEVGRHRYSGAPYLLSRTPWRLERPAPLLGQHNREVYVGELGLFPEEFDSLRTSGVISWGLV